jgi:hypothetical protein
MEIDPTCQFYQHMTRNVCAKKLQSQNITREKLREALLYEKLSHKMLMCMNLQQQQQQQPIMITFVTS